MSENTQCNWHTLQRMKYHAKQRGAHVILTHEPDGWVSVRYSDQEGPSAWFKELTSECAC